MRKSMLCKWHGIVIYGILTVPLLLYIIINGLWTNIVEIIPWVGYVWFASQMTNKIYSWIQRKAK